MASPTTMVCAEAERVLRGRGPPAVPSNKRRVRGVVAFSAAALAARSESAPAVVRKVRRDI